jgi:DNA repair exonuclease SbcCD ATPase subunit
MKKLGFFTVVILLLASCGQGQKAREAMEQEIDSLQKIINERDVELNDIMGTFEEVQEGIRRINEAEGRVTVADATPENASNKEVIRENMSFIHEAMQQNRDMIDQLKEKLRSSTFNAEKLRKTVENLQAQVETQSQRIQELEAALAEKDAQLFRQGQRIDVLNENVDMLTEENKQKAATVASQEKMLNTAWFVFGTKSELKAQKILQKGDVLRDGNFNKDYFTQIDIRYDKVIKLYSKSATILTNHPTGSYQMIKDSKGLCELHISDPSKFWSTGKYLVVQVK